MERSTEFMFGIPWIMSFFHQDWTLDASTAAEAVADQFVEELEPEAVLLVRRDAELLLDKLPSDRITVLWQQGVETGEHFFRRARAMDGAEWMRQVLGLCDAWLSRRSGTPALSGADRYEGRDLADQVLSVVEKFQAPLGQDVTDALAKCVHHCTPDLAFRLLLQVLPTKSASLSPEYLYLSAEQYAGLEALGKAFHYGQYVVSDIEYLVTEQAP
jgi:hypothetical protein